MTLGATNRNVDVVLVVPFQPITAHAMDPVIRQTVGAHLGARLSQAVAEFEEFLGHSLGVLQWTDHPVLHGLATAFPIRRSLTAVALATHLQKHGLSWRAIDPGAQDLRYWRRCFEQLRARPPRVVALSTSFIISAAWLRAFCAVVRRTLPGCKLVVGGSFYLTSVQEFLSLDADVFCVGEGEHRLPQIVEAICAGKPVDAIPGLYCRSAEGTLRFTGVVAPLVLDQLAAPDWSLSQRIEPPLELDGEPGYYLVETQRGCRYRCEFCTFRTVTRHVLMSPDSAAAAILRTRTLPRGYVFLVDATATSPRNRWEEILARLVEQGGSPHPIVAFARVTDITEPIAEWMAWAGVRGVVVGQESGDQQLLNTMKKGIQVEHVARAVAALGKHGIGAQFCFMHGFPGETAQSIQATRAMITTLNQGFERELVVPTYVVIPFYRFDLASVSGSAEMRNVRHPLGYESAAFTPQRVAEEMLGTLVAGSRVAHAPLCSFLFNGLADFLFNVRDQGRRSEIFRWLKAFERGVGMFLERGMEGTPPDRSELRRLREEVLAHCPRHSSLRSALSRMMSRGRARQSRRIRAEWLQEKQCGPGWLTKGYAAFCTYRDFGRWRDALAAWRTGNYPEVGSSFPPDASLLEGFSAELARGALSEKR